MKTVTVKIDPKIFLYIVIALGVGLLVWTIKEVMLLFLFAFILNAALKPLVDKLEARRIPRPVSIALMFLFVFVIVAVIMLIIANQFLDQFVNLINTLPQIVKNTSALIERYLPFLAEILPLRELTKEAETIADTTAKNDFIRELLGGQNVLAVINQAYGAFGSVAGLIFRIFAVLFISAYMLNKGDKVYEDLLIYVPNEKIKKQVRKSTHRIEATLGQWLTAQLGMMLMISIMTYILLVIPGFFFPNYTLDEFALPLAIFAGFLEAIPTFGVLMLQLIAGILALGGDGVGSFIYVLLSIQLIQNVQNIFIVPIVYKRSVGLDPVVSVLGIMAGFQIGGIAGAVIIIPVLTIIKILIEEVYAYFKETKDEYELMNTETGIESAKSSPKPKLKSRATKMSVAIAKHN